MITLLIDVVSNNSILALFDQKKSQKAIEKIRLDHNEMRSENVIPALESLLDNSTYCYSDIKKVICVTGPGNYTNIRTGISNFEYETRENNLKRQIQILKIEYLQQFLNDFRDIMVYDKSSQYVDETTATTENSNLMGSY